MRYATIIIALAASVLGAAVPVHAFTSGSTGADGAFNPTVNTQVVLPASGVLNYTTFNIPTGVTVTFQKNTANKPVTILASGDVTIAGTIDVSGAASTDVGAAGSGNPGDDGLPGIGGAGGYNGGPGGAVGTIRNGGAGLGPGGGGAGVYVFTSGYGTYIAYGGAGGGFATAGAIGNLNNTAVPGPAYGASALLPLIGGSGGGGAASGATFPGSGGGGGGGAILIAASGTINVTGSILANGGSSGANSGGGDGGAGGGGSGGAIRLIATTISGNGTISANGGAVGAIGNSSPGGYYAGTGGAGSVGRIRLEAGTLTRTAGSTPTYSFAAPGTVFIAGQPTLTITSVAGSNAPANPTGVADIQLPSSTPNPVTVIFATTGVPVGNIVNLTVTPAYGTPVTAVSNALSGTTTNATASATVNLPAGASTLQATITYTVVASLGDALSRYAGNERVEKVTVIATADGGSQVRLITVSGKDYPAPAAALVALAR